MAARPLIFPWQKPRKGDWRVALFVFIAFLIHGVAFYLFQVSYPPGERVTPLETRVTLLHPADPSVAQLLRQVDDATVMLGVVTEKEPLEMLQNGSLVAFQPSFRDYRIDLKELEQPVERFQLPEIAQPGAVVFPEPAASSEEPAEEAMEPGQLMLPELVFQGDLEGRETEIRKAFLPRPLEGRGRARVRVAASPDGLVQTALVEEEPSGGLPEDFGARLRQAIRFEAADSLAWGWVEIYW